MTERTPDQARIGDDGRIRVKADAGSPRPSGWQFLADHQVTAPRMLVKDLLPYDGIAFIGGQSGAGKTFVAVDLSVAIPSKTPFFGKRVNERVGVGYLAAEGVEQLGNRFTAAARARGVEIKNLPVAWRGDMRAIKTARDVETVAGQIKELAAYIRARYRVRLGIVVLDTVAATFDLEDEDKNSEVARAIRAMRKIGKDTGALVIPVHHYGKTATTGLRGASAWRAGADVVLSVTAERNELTGKVTGRELALAKARDGIEGPIAPFALTFAELGVNEQGDKFGTCIVEPQFDAPSLTATERPKREAQSLRVFRQAFAEALDTHGKPIRIRSDGPMVKAVDITHVRTEFNARWATGEADQKKRDDAQRKAFGRILKETDRLYPRWVNGSTEWIWRFAQADIPDKTDIADMS